MLCVSYRHGNKERGVEDSQVVEVSTERAVGAGM